MSPSPTRPPERRHDDALDLPDATRAWIDRRFPHPRSPVAAVVAGVLSAVFGRIWWVIGAVLMAFAAPGFVHAYRHIEAMSQAAWYRHAASVHAEARLDGIELHLVPFTQGDYDLGHLLSLRLQMEDGRIVRYYPDGHWRSAERRLRLFGEGVTGPLKWSPDWSLSFGTVDGLDLYWNDQVDADLAEDGGVRIEEESLRDYMLSPLRQPVDWLLLRWMLDPETTRIPVRHPPGNPDRVFVADALEHSSLRFGDGGRGGGTLFGMLLFLGPLGLLWWVGSQLAASGLPRRYRHVAAWLPLLMLPAWHSGYLNLMQRYLPDARAQVDTMRHGFGEIAVLPASEPVDAKPARTPRAHFDLVGDPPPDSMLGVDLRPPSAPLAAAPAWAELEARFAQALAKLDDEALTRRLSDILSREPQRKAFGTIMLEGVAREIENPARSAALRDAGATFVVEVMRLSNRWVEACHPAHAGLLARADALRSHSHPAVAEVAEYRWQLETAEASKRDGLRPGC